MTSRTNTAGLGYTYSLTMTPQNRVSQAGSTDSAFAYDASGNVLSDGLNIYSYDGEGRLHAVNGATNYVYGPEGERVATVQSGAVSAEYLYGVDGTLTTELAPGGKLMRGLLYGGGMHLADYTQDGKTVFHLSDEVGSLVNTIDQTGAAIETCAASPFGESLNCSPSVDYTENHFTDNFRMGAAQQLEIDVREPAENNRLREKAGESGILRGKRTLLYGNGLKIGAFSPARPPDVLLIVRHILMRPAFKSRFARAKAGAHK